MPDHVHLFIESDPRWAVAEIVNRLKGYTSRILRSEFRYLRSGLPTLSRWSRSYDAGTVGHGREATMRRSSECQTGKGGPTSTDSSRTPTRSGNWLRCWRRIVGCTTPVWLSGKSGIRLRGPESPSWRSILGEPCRSVPAAAVLLGRHSANGGTPANVAVPCIEITTPPGTSWHIVWPGRGQWAPRSAWADFAQEAAPFRERSRHTPSSSSASCSSRSRRDSVNCSANTCTWGHSRPIAIAAVVRS